MGPGALGAPSAAKGGLGARLLGTSASPVLLARRPLALNREKPLAAALQPIMEAAHTARTRLMAAATGRKGHHAQLSVQPVIRGHG